AVGVVDQLGRSRERPPFHGGGPGDVEVQVVGPVVAGRRCEGEGLVGEQQGVAGRGRRHGASAVSAVPGAALVAVLVVGGAGGRGGRAGALVPPGARVGAAARPVVVRPAVVRLPGQRPGDGQAGHGEGGGRDGQDAPAP